MLHVLLGGTGTLGRALTEVLLSETNGRIRVMARGEHRLMDMKRLFSSERVSYIVGDVRDEDKVRRVLEPGCRVYHMAALKHVHTCEYSVLEAVKTNVTGTANVIQAAIDKNVERVMLVSTDKAVEPTTAYGATKMLAERMFIGANAYAPEGRPSFACVRYGNVLGSQGSVVEVWAKQSLEGYVTIADPATTRFWWTIRDAARFVYNAMACARRGDVMIPRMAACSLGDLATLVAPTARVEDIEPYGTEKTHEVLLASHEAPNATLANGMDAIRVSCVLQPPTDERRWNGTMLRSSDCIDVRGVGQCLGRV